MFQHQLKSDQNSKKKNDNNTKKKSNSDLNQLYKTYLMRKSAEESVSSPAIDEYLAKRSSFTQNTESASSFSGAVQKKSVETEKTTQLFVREEEETAQAKENPSHANENGSSTGSEGTTVHLPKNLQTKMEGSFGTDLSSVNIHKDDTSATQMGALAYTQGENVHFAPGKYNPQSKEGTELLGHELTHVIQQRQGRVPGTQNKNGISVNDSPSLENEADSMGKNASEGKPSQVKGYSSGIQKKEVKSHFIVRGDTLSELAEQYNVSVEDLARWNNVSNIDVKYAGNALFVEDPGISLDSTSQSESSLIKDPIDQKFIGDHKTIDEIENVDDIVKAIRFAHANPNDQSVPEWGRNLMTYMENEDLGYGKIVQFFVEIVPKLKTLTKVLDFSEHVNGRVTLWALRTFVDMPDWARGFLGFMGSNLDSKLIQGTQTALKKILEKLIPVIEERLPELQAIDFNLDKVHELDDEQLKTLIEVFRKGLDVAEYKFDYEQGIFYTTQDAYQQIGGYCDKYDELANTDKMFRIDFFSIPIVADIRGNSNKEVCKIRGWKGNYWGAAGGEIGCYTNDNALLKELTGEEATDASKNFMLKMGFILKDENGNKIFQRYKEENWWVIGLKPLSQETWADMRGKFTMEAVIDFDAYPQLFDGFIAGAMSEGITIVESAGNTVVFEWK